MRRVLKFVQSWCCKHHRPLHHAHHGLHTSYLGWYVIDWHLPVGPIALGLLIVAIISWIFKLNIE